MTKNSSKSNLTKMYGISFMSDEEQTQKVNDNLAQNNSTLLYTPKKFRMNIYFPYASEAYKVSQYLNSKQDGRYYNVFPTSLESLEHIKRIYENNKNMPKKSPLMYHKLTGFRVYNSADEYLKVLKETEKSRMHRQEEM